MFSFEKSANLCRRLQVCVVNNTNIIFLPCGDRLSIVACFSSWHIVHGGRSWKGGRLSEWHIFSGQVGNGGMLSPGGRLSQGGIMSRGISSRGVLSQVAGCLQVADCLGADCLGAYCLWWHIMGVAYCLGACWSRAYCLGASCPSTVNRD